MMHIARLLRTSPWVLSMLVASTFLVDAGCGLFAADAKSANEEQIATVSAQAKRFVEQCRFVPTAAGTMPFRRHPEPILRWSNPTAGAVYGDIYLYTDRGRPAVALSYYRWFTPDWGSTIEVCAMTPSRFVGEVDGKHFWKPEPASLNSNLMPDAEPPAATAAARLIQLRRLATDFRAQLVDTRANEAGVQRTLRRLTQPVYRYATATADADYVDGALFAFVEGTDPELLLMIEAVSSSKGNVWQYGVARMNRDAIELLHHDRVVWEASYITDPNERFTAPYSTFSAEKPLKPVP